MSAFWTYTLDFYRREGVQPAVIHLQDARGADVNLLIYAAWTAALGLPGFDRARAAALAATVEPWRASAIEPLRAIRTTLRAGVDHAPEDEAKALRGQVLKLEIEAERIEQAMIESATPEAAGREPGEPDAVLVARNLAAVAGLNVRPISEADGAALRAVLAAACPAASASTVDDALKTMA